jgi:hypothetical protein
MRKIKNPFTGEMRDYPEPKTFLCPKSGPPTRETISRTLQFDAPKPLVDLARWIYDDADGDPYKCSESFSEKFGIGSNGPKARYSTTPCELFPIGGTGCDGDHYGFVVHAPELESADYPVASFCPMDSDGVAVRGRDTIDGLAWVIAFWGDRTARAYGPAWKAAIDKVLPKSGERWPADRELTMAQVVAVPGGWRFEPTTDGIGVLAPAEKFAPGPFASFTRETTAKQHVAAVDKAIKAGFPATALYYLRENAWQWSWKKCTQRERLTDVYELLGRPSLAKVNRERIKTFPDE